MSNFSLNSAVGQTIQQNSSNNIFDLFENQSFDGMQLMQQLDRLNMSSASAGLSFMTSHGMPGAQLLDQSMSIGPATNSFLNISQNSQIMKK